MTSAVTHRLGELAQAVGQLDDPTTAARRCSLCGLVDEGHALKDVISGNFGDYDKLHWLHSLHLCRVCTWSFRDRSLRLYPHAITSAYVGRCAPEQLCAILSSPLNGSDVLCVPIGGKRHLLPYAAIGVAATDAGSLLWNQADCERLLTIARLRTLGFGEGALIESAPRWLVMRKLRPTERAEALTLWEQLDPWRRCAGYLDVAMRATRTTKETR